MNLGLLLPVPSSYPLGIKKLLIVTGIVLCLTIIGIVPGLVFIIVGFLIPSLMTKGVCPVCENELFYGQKNGACTCYYCHKRLLIKNGILTTIDGKIHHSIVKTVVKEASPQQSTPWYKTTGATIALLIFLFPVGLFTMWKYMKWNNAIKWVITGVLILFILPKNNSETNSTTSKPVPTKAEVQEVKRKAEKPTPVPTEDCSQSVNPQMCIRMEINREPKLDATTQLTNAGLVVTNNGDIDWRLCTVTIGSAINDNTAYEVSGWDIKFPAHQTTTVPWGDFTQDNGNRFNYYTTQPNDIELDCSVNSEQEHLRIN